MKLQIPNLLLNHYQIRKYLLLQIQQQTELHKITITFMSQSKLWTSIANMIECYLKIDVDSINQNHLEQLKQNLPYKQKHSQKLLLIFQNQNNMLIKNIFVPLLILIYILQSSFGLILQLSSNNQQPSIVSSLSKILPLPFVNPTPSSKSVQPLTNLINILKPVVNGLKCNCPIQVIKTPKPSGQFGGFTDSFKQEMAYMIGQITNIATPEAKALKDKIMKGLVSINNILKIINQFPNKQDDLKPLLQKQVAAFLNDLDDIQQLLSKQTNVTVIGNNNAAYANTGYIQGNNTTIVGNQNTAVGNSNIVAGTQSVVGGTNNAVQGSGGITVGKNNTVTGNNTYTFANNEVVNQSNTLTIGNNTIDLVKLQNGTKTAGYLIKN